MSLTLHYHPLSSFCHKALIALYENGTAFTPQLVDLGNPEAAAAFRKVWPLGRFPVLRDEARGLTVPESTVLIEYLAQHHPGPVALLPADEQLRFRARELDRLFDLYVNVPMQKIVTDRLRPEGCGDAFGVEQAKAQLRTALDVLDARIGDGPWAVGEVYSIADVAASPALFYAAMVAPFAQTHPRLHAYAQRLQARPSFARVLREAQPYLAMMPKA